MFYYFGRKSRLASVYPKPGSLVIEPFAGSMAYTLHHKPESAIGVEADAIIYATWQRVVALSPQELLNYPEPIRYQRTFDRWAMMAAGSHGTAKAQSYLWTERMSRDFGKQRRMAMANVEYAQTIDYRHGSYQDLPDIEATWFIDPPYQRVKRGYRHNINYAELAVWCRSRRGLVIVCEQQGADWLPFRPIAETHGTTNRWSTEMVWVDS